LTLFPNPTNDELIIKTETGVYNLYAITNGVGQVMAKGQLRSKETTIDVKTLPPGMYYFTAAGEGISKVVKFVKL
jgi:hypothetical protein